jgi:hypothetical protein
MWVRVSPSVVFHPILCLPSAPKDLRVLARKKFYWKLDWIAISKLVNCMDVPCTLLLHLLFLQFLLRNGRHITNTTGLGILRVQ